MNYNNAIFSFFRYIFYSRSVKIVFLCATIYCSFQICAKIKLQTVCVTEQIQFKYNSSVLWSRPTGGRAPFSQINFFNANKFTLYLYVYLPLYTIANHYSVAAKLYWLISCTVFRIFDDLTVNPLLPLIVHLRRIEYKKTKTISLQSVVSYQWYRCNKCKTIVCFTSLAKRLNNDCFMGYVILAFHGRRQLKPNVKMFFSSLHWVFTKKEILNSLLLLLKRPAGDNGWIFIVVIKTIKPMKYENSCRTIVTKKNYNCFKR